MKLRIAGMALITLIACSPKATIEDGQRAARSGDYLKANTIYRTLANAGNADAQYWLGQSYADGLGVSRDPEQALKWFRLAAERNPGYQYQLANMLSAGLKVPKGQVEAIKWYRRASENGVVFAMDWLGLALLNGEEGVPKNLDEAYFWLIQAKAGGGAGLAPSYLAELENELGPTRVHDCQRRAAESWKTIQSKRVP